MGYSTHYLGAFRIDPPLNPEETAWLRSFRRSHRPLFTDPHEVPMNPGVVPTDHPLVTSVGSGAAFSGAERGGGPSTCDWEPSVDGRQLLWDGRFFLLAAADNHIDEVVLEPGWTRWRRFVSS